MASQRSLTKRSRKSSNKTWHEGRTNFLVSEHVDSCCDRRSRRRDHGNRIGCLLDFEMIEEPYRWVEAIANRREYIETQLAQGSPIAAVGYRDGIFFVTLGRARQKIFGIFDRIAMGAVGDPGDIERVAVGGIRLASTGGFTPAS